MDSQLTGDRPAKQPYKSFTIAQHPDTSTSKYISRLKQLYNNNKEWNSSNETLNRKLAQKNDKPKYIEKLVNNYQAIAAPKITLEPIKLERPKYQKSKTLDLSDFISLNENKVASPV